MSDSQSATFPCASCGKVHKWKLELAGKRGKCKCGNVITVPAQPPSDEGDLYALVEMAADAQKAVAKLPPPVAREEVVAAPVPGKAVRPTKSLNYFGAPTAAEKSRNSAATFIDMKRDCYAPIVFLVIGVVLHVSYYALRYNFGFAGVIGTTIGLAIISIFETVLLMVFALTIAGPLGVSFGGIWTAILKLAAIAVFCDGVTTWIDGAIMKYAAGVGGGGFFGFGAIGLPVAIGIYWVLLIYLFHMDSGDSWLVVVLLSVFYRIMRIVLLLLLLKLILTIGGVAASSISIPGSSGPAASSTATEQIDEMEQAQNAHTLHEARKYASDYRRDTEAPWVEKWYAAGAPNVWFQSSRDINGHGSAFRIVLELPKNAAGRKQCFDTAKAYYDSFHWEYLSEELKDNGDPYLFIPLAQ